jgi:HEAT repeat protein
MASHTQGVAQSASFIRRMTLVSALLVAACHADDNDPKGQAEELSDPVRREHAIGRLQSIFSTRLVEAKGDRAHASIKEFSDATHDALTKTYLDNRNDTNNGLSILRLMGEMRDPRTLPALLAALEWQAEVNEDHAVAAAVTLTELDVPPDRKGEVIEKIGAALAKVDGKRPVDVRMRKGFIEALGKLKDKRTTPILVEIALKQDENQSFLFNLLATQQLVATADPAAVDAMVKGLYMFDPTNPQNRMNEDAQAVLVAIGPPSLEPLLKTLKGENNEVNELVKLSIETFRRLDPNMASTMVMSNLVAHEATIALGKLGMREALEPLLKETEHSNPERRANAAIALVGLARQEGDTPRILAAVTKVYEASDKQVRPQLLVAIRHLYDDAVMPFLLKVASTTETELPPVQMYAFISHVMLAGKSEVQPLKGVLEKEELIKPHLKDYDVAIKLAEACDKNVDCYVGKLNDTDKIVLRKAANMLARFGKGNDKALEGLVGLLGHDDLEVRSEALYAIDHLATKGSQLAVDKISALQAAEEGRSIWNNFKREALPTRSRLLVRSGS